MGPCHAPTGPHALAVAARFMCVLGSGAVQSALQWTPVWLRSAAWQSGRCVQAATDVPVDGSQEGGGTGRLRSKRAETTSRKGDAVGAGHKSTLSCFSMPQVADDDVDGSLDDGPLLIEVCPVCPALRCSPVRVLQGRAALFVATVPPVLHASDLVCGSFCMLRAWCHVSPDP